MPKIKKERYFAPLTVKTLPYYAKASYNAYRNAKSLAKSAQNIKNRRLIRESSLNTPGVIGTQDQYVRQYKKRRTTRKQRRRRRGFNKFRRRVRAVQNVDLPKTHITYNDTIVSQASVNTQQWEDFAIYGSTSASARPGYNDLKNIFDANGAITKEAKFRFLMARMDVTIRNVEADGGNQHVAEIDVYQIKPKSGTKNLEMQPDLFSNFSVGLGQATQYDVTAPTAAITTTTDLGSTPFQCNFFTERFTILKKDKYKLAYGETMTFSYTDKRNYYYQKEKTTSQTNQYYRVPSFRGFLIMFRGVPTNSASTSDKTHTVRLKINTTRNYMFTFKDDEIFNWQSATNPQA